MVFLVKFSEVIMNPSLIKAAGDMLKEFVSLTNKAMDFADSEKYAKSVADMHNGSDKCFQLMRDIIQNDPHMDAAEKLDRLAIIEEKERAAKKHYGEMLDQHQVKAMTVVKDVFIGFLTAGVYFMPKIIGQIKSELKTKNQIPPAPVQEVLDFVEINDVDVEDEND